MKKLLLVFGLIFLVNSCDDNMSYKQEMSDMQLIEAIASDPNKFEIDEVDVPAMSLFSIGEEYYDYMMYKAEISPEYGYQISLGDMALDAGDMTEIFFSKDGRKLGGRDGMDERKRHKKRCFKFVFPLSFNLGETSYTVNDYTEFHAAMKAHYEATGVKEKPAFAYPIQIEFRGEDAETATINSDEELKEAFQACRGEQDDKKCFTFGFPVSFTMPDGSVLTAEDEEDLEAKMQAFYESYEGKKKRPRVIFPVELIFEDGSSLTVNSVQEMRQAWKDNCKRGGGDESNGGETRG
ncbi:MAG: hypothetical protein CMG16_01900 [Candidatus Marinimicrobia bacterium]|nr:hypothetical protein [Candidatus Neomarinimicrobiota bacterium]MAS39913.1 hypothetical protein [Candidatus Neomarinimicrobiota bacterium]